MITMISSRIIMWCEKGKVLKKGTYLFKHKYSSNTQSRGKNHILHVHWILPTQLIQTYFNKQNQGPKDGTYFNNGNHNRSQDNKARSFHVIENRKCKESMPCIHCRWAVTHLCCWALIKLSAALVSIPLPSRTRIPQTGPTDDTPDCIWLEIPPRNAAVTPLPKPLIRSTTPSSEDNHQIMHLEDDFV